MAGHSKWAQIKRKKGVADAKRGAVFSKLASAITIAAKNGTDAEMNFALRIAVDQAKAANMPKDNIDRAIARAGGAGGVTLEEIMFEAYGPGGTAFLIETATDNRNRTIGEVKAALNKFGGKLAEAGAVGYLFKKRGQIVLETSDADAVELAAIDAGAEDVEADDGKVFVYTDPKELEQVRKNLAASQLESNDVGFERQPTAMIKIEDKSLADRILKLSDALDDLDDVTNIHSNVDIPENLLS